MFEISKFNKKYPLLKGYIKDKNQANSLLLDSCFYNSYQEISKELKELITNLDKLYSPEITKDIIYEKLISNASYSFVLASNEKVKDIIYFCEQYHHDLGPVKDVDIDTIISCYNIRNLVLDKCFLYDYNDDLKLGNKDVKDLFLDSDDSKLKEQLYLLLQKNNLDMFVNMVNNLKGEDLDFNDLEELFQDEIDDILYDKNIIAGLGQDTYSEVIKYFFSNNTKQDKEFIIAILKQGNYETLKILLELLPQTKYRIANIININDIDKKIFEVKLSHDIHMSYILFKRLTSSAYINYNMIDKLIELKGVEYFKELISSNLDLVNLCIKLRNYDNLSSTEKEQLFNLLNSYTDEDRLNNDKRINTINAILEKETKKFFTDKIDTTIKLINEAKEKNIVDTNGNNHNLKIYDLEGEDFNLLITAMHNYVWQNENNLYGRVKHKEIIDNPDTFTQDISRGSSIISTSMINNNYIQTFVGPKPDLMYAFTPDVDDILHISPEDAGIDPKAVKIDSVFHNNIILTPEELMNQTATYHTYNEIDIKRTKDEKKVLPSAIVCFNRVNDIAIKHAEYFNIPIIVIHANKYTLLSNIKEEEKDKII